MRYAGAVPQFLYKVSDDAIELGDYFIQFNEERIPILRKAVTFEFYDEKVSPLCPNNPLQKYFEKYGYYTYPLIFKTLIEKYECLENLKGFREKVIASNDDRLYLSKISEDEIKSFIEKFNLVKK